MSLSSLVKAQFSLFTIIPARASGEEIEQLARTFWTVPLVGLFFGAVAGATFFLANQVFSAFVAALLAILFVHGFNRFLHIDGLSDLGDGLIAGGGKEKKVAAMKDSRSGAGGVAFLFFFEALGIFALASFASERSALWFFAPLAAEVLAKNALVSSASVGKPSQGLGGIFVGGSNGTTASLSAMLSFVILFALALLLLPFTHWSLLLALIICLSLVLVSTAVGWAIARISMRSFGMVNGDVLGATNEIARPVALMALTVVMFCLA